MAENVRDQNGNGDPKWKSSSQDRCFNMILCLGVFVISISIGMAIALLVLRIISFFPLRTSSPNHNQEEYQVSEFKGPQQQYTYDNFTYEYSDFGGHD